MSKAIYFLSDLHLGAAYITQPLEHEKRIVRFLDSIKDKAAEIYLLGDILDYWYEYSHVVPKGFVRFFGKIAELADSGIKIHWLIGNHDIWIFDYLPHELGIEVIDGILQREILGKNFFMNHGDGVGKHKLSFRIIRSIFRNKVCQFFYSMLPSSITIPFAHRWSNSSRKKGNLEAEEKIQMHKQHILDFAKSHSASSPHTHFYIFGHLHLADKINISQSATTIFLGDWTEKFTYAIFDGNEITLHSFA